MGGGGVEAARAGEDKKEEEVLEIGAQSPCIL
jgi:hypothetical protein